MPWSSGCFHHQSSTLLWYISSSTLNLWRQFLNKNVVIDRIFLQWSQGDTMIAASHSYSFHHVAILWWRLVVQPTLACPKLCEYPSIFDNCCISLYPTAQSIRDQAVGRVGSVGSEIMLLAAEAMVWRATMLGKAPWWICCVFCCAWWQTLWWREACLCRTVSTPPHVDSQYFST